MEFSPPAQFQGKAEASGAQWIIFLFHGGRGGNLKLALPGGADQVNQTFLQAKRTGFDNENPAAPLPPRTSKLPAATNANLNPLEGAWASLIIEAKSITISAEGSDGSLRQAKSGDYMPSHFPPVSYPEDAISAGLNTPRWLWTDSDGTVVNAASTRMNEPLPFAIKVEGLERVRWHNFTTSCASQSCPDAGAPWGTSTEVEGTTWLQRLSYIELEAPSGTLVGQGHAVAIAMGGPAIDLVLRGSLRLPDTSLTGDCPDGPCSNPAGRTFSATGNITLQGMTGDDGSGRLHAQLAGDFAAAFDESPAIGFAVAAAAATAVVLAGAVWLVKFLIGLFARSARRPALDHPRRRAVFEAIQAHPGLSWNGLRRHLDWPDGTLRFHLGRLLEDGLVVKQRLRNTVRLFENHGRYSRTWRQVAPLQDPEARRLHEWLLRNPGVDQTCVVNEAAGWAWTRAKARRRLQVLVEAGLVSVRSVGRHNEYTAKPAVT